MLLKVPNLSSASVSHGFFTREGGVSQDIYASLNCGHGTKDQREYVNKNRAAVARELGTAAGNLLSLHQVHGVHVITVTESWNVNNRPQGDGMVTTKPGIALGILTADCVPILLADKKKNIIGAAHAGWRGALAGIAEATVNAMESLGAKRETIAAAIGPAIAQSSYEVDSTFHAAWLHKSPDNQKYFIPAKSTGKFLFDLKRAVYDTLLNYGVTDINLLENDTYLEEDRFFSYRRAVHAHEADYGRQISAIMLR